MLIVAVLDMDLPNISVAVMVNSTSGFAEVAVPSYTTTTLAVLAERDGVKLTETEEPTTSNNGLLVVAVTERIIVLPEKLSVIVLL